MLFQKRDAAADDDNNEEDDHDGDDEANGQTLSLPRRTSRRQQKNQEIFHN